MPTVPFPQVLQLTFAHVQKGDTIQQFSMKENSRNEEKWTQWDATMPRPYVRYI